MRKFFAKIGAGFTALFVTTQAALAGGTYDSITTAVDWSEVTTGIVAIAALIAAVLVVKRGSGMLLRMIGR